MRARIRSRGRAKYKRLCWCVFVRALCGRRRLPSAANVRAAGSATLSSQCPPSTLCATPYSTRRHRKHRTCLCPQRCRHHQSLRRPTSQTTPLGPATTSIPVPEYKARRRLGVQQTSLSSSMPTTASRPRRTSDGRARAAAALRPRARTLARHVPGLPIFLTFCSPASTTAVRPPRPTTQAPVPRHTSDTVISFSRRCPVPTMSVAPLPQRHHHFTS